MNKIYFFTATILKWIQILRDDKYKDIVIESLIFLINEKRVRLYSFVIMPNHIHLVWQILEPHILPDVQRDFLKFTAQNIKLKMQKENKLFLNKFLVNSADRKFQIWQRKPLSVELFTEKVIEQKINYIHANPCREKWNLCKYAHEYRYSSARFYYDGFDEWGLFKDLKYY
ncbi:MAG TPA: transposase [Ignavibacteria bacterium]|nr:transposase [Ignavibacteria bacterium]